MKHLWHQDRSAFCLSPYLSFKITYYDVVPFSFISYMPLFTTETYTSVHPLVLLLNYYKYINRWICGLSHEIVSRLFFYTLSFIAPTTCVSSWQSCQICWLTYKIAYSNLVMLRNSDFFFDLCQFFVLACMRCVAPQFVLSRNEMTAQQTTLHSIRKLQYFNVHTCMSVFRAINY